MDQGRNEEESIVSRMTDPEDYIGHWPEAFWYPEDGVFHEHLFGPEDSHQKYYDPRPEIPIKLSILDLGLDLVYNDSACFDLDFVHSSPAFTLEDKQTFNSPTDAHRLTDGYDSNILTQDYLDTDGWKDSCRMIWTDKCFRNDHYIIVSTDCRFAHLTKLTLLHSDQPREIRVKDWQNAYGKIGYHDCTHCRH